jgi:hypothetical protein
VNHQIFISVIVLPGLRWWRQDQCEIHMLRKLPTEWQIALQPQLWLGLLRPYHKADVLSAGFEQTVSGIQQVGTAYKPRLRHWTRHQLCRSPTVNILASIILNWLTTFCTYSINSSACLTVPRELGLLSATTRILALRGSCQETTDPRARTTLTTVHYRLLSMALLVTESHVCIDV